MSAKQRHRDWDSDNMVMRLKSKLSLAMDGNRPAQRGSHIDSAAI